MRVEGWVGDDAVGFEGLATLLKLAWLEPRSLELAIERSKHGTEITVVCGDESAMLSSELLSGRFDPLFSSVLEQTVLAPTLVSITAELASEVSRLEQLEQATDSVLLAQSLDEVLDACVGGVVDALDFGRAALFVKDDGRATWTCARAKSEGDDPAFERAARAIALSAPQVTSFESAKAALAPLAPGRDAVLLRVAWRSDVLGYLFTDGVSSGAPDDRVDLLERFLRQVAASWQDFRLLHKVEAQSRHDKETGLANRRELDARLTHERSRAQRMKTSLGFLMVDLDALEDAVADSVVSRDGSPTGGSPKSALLRSVGTIFREELRAHDLAARFDDGRLAVILPGAGAFEAALVARRIGLAARRKDTSLSIGAACFPDDCDHPDDLVALATSHLEAAIGGGRGRACLSRDGDPIVFADEEDAG